MKINELRVGNLVYYADNKTILCVTGGSICYPSKMYPIPLTEEWLIKFGFNKKCDYEQQEWEWGKLCGLNSRRGVGLYNYTGEKYIDYWCVTFREDVGCGWADLNEIEYIHQLQNLYFALTGEELTYET